MKQDYLFVPVNLNIECYSLRETGLIGLTSLKGNVLALSPPSAPVHFWPLNLWESGPLAQVEPNSQRKRWPPATDLELWHCHVLPFDLLIFLSYVTIALCLVLITTVWFHLFHTTDLIRLQTDHSVRTLFNSRLETDFIAGLKLMWTRLSIKKSKATYRAFFILPLFLLKHSMYVWQRSLHSDI